MGKVRDFVKDTVSSTSSDHVHRPQRVNKEIEACNAKLTSIRQDLDTLEVLKRLPQDKGKSFVDRVTRISEGFTRYSQEAIKDYGKYTSRFSHDKRQRAFEELTKFNSILKEMHDNLSKAKQIWTNLNYIKQGSSLLPEKYRLQINKDINEAISDINKVYDKALDYSVKEDSLLISDEAGELREKAWKELEKPINRIQDTRDYVRAQRITSLDQWYNSYMKEYKKQYKINHGVDFEESFIQGLQEWKRKYDDNSVSTVPYLQESIQQPKLPNDLKQSIDTYDELCLFVENAGIDFLNIMDRMAGSAVSLLRDRIEGDREDFEKSRGITLTDQEEAYSLYKDSYHTVAKIVKTYGPGGSLNQEQSFQALGEAHEQIASFQRYLQQFAKD